MGWRFFPPGPYSQKNQKFFPESKTPLGGHANSPPLHTIILSKRGIFMMFNVYEVYTWDDVSYTKLSSFEKKEDAEK